MALEDRSVIDLWYRRLPRYLYLEELVAGRTIVEIGCGLGVGCDFLREQGASRVVGIDRDEALLERARKRYSREGVEFQRWVAWRGLPVGDASCDLIVVPEAKAWLAELGFLEDMRRVLKPEGNLVVAVPSADRPGSASSDSAAQAVSYYDLVETLEPVFGRVRMMGQSPFLGYALVEYAEGAESPDLSLDTSLVDGGNAGEGVSHYVALCGPDPRPARGYTIVQIPFEPIEHRLLSLATPAIRGAEGTTGNGNGHKATPHVPGAEVVLPPHITPVITPAESAPIDLNPGLTGSASPQAAPVLADVEAREQLEARVRAAEAKTASLERKLGEMQGRMQEERALFERRLADAHALVRQAGDSQALAGVESAREQLALEGEIERLNARNLHERTEYERKLARLQAELDEHVDPSGRLPATASEVLVVTDTNELRERDDRIGWLMGERQGLEWRVSELEGQLAAGERHWQGIVADLEERARTRDDALDESAEAARRHHEQTRMMSDELAERTELARELERQRTAAELALAVAERAAAEHVVRIEELEGKSRVERKRLAQLEGGILREAHAPKVDIHVMEQERAALEETLRKEAADQSARADAEVAKIKERLALADSQTALWMTKFRESERKAEEARGEATRKLLDSKSAAGLQLQRALEESTRKLSSARDEAMRAQRDRDGAEQKAAQAADELKAALTRLGEAEQALAAARTERNQLEAKMNVVLAERQGIERALAEGRHEQARLSARVGELERAVVDRDQQIQRLAGAAEAERRSTMAAAEREREVKGAVRAAATAREEAAREVQSARDQLLRVQDELTLARAEVQRLQAAARADERAGAERMVALEAQLSEALAQAPAARGEQTAAGEAAEDQISVAQLVREAQAQVARLEKELKAAQRELVAAGKVAAAQHKALEKAHVEHDDRKQELLGVRRELRLRDKRDTALRAELKDRDDKLARLAAELAATGKQIAKLEKASQPRTKATAGTTKEGARGTATDDQLARLREELKFRKADLEETESALAQARGREEQLAMELARREAELEKALVEREKAERSVKVEAELRQRAVDEARRAGERAQTARGDAEAARADAGRARAAEAGAREREKQAASEGEERKERLKTLKREVDAAERRLQRETQRAERMERMVDDSTQGAERAAREVADLRKNLAELGAQAAERAARVSTLEARIAAGAGPRAPDLTRARSRLQAFEAGLHLSAERLAGIEDMLAAAAGAEDRVSEALDRVATRVRIMNERAGMLSSAELGALLSELQEELERALR
jgi:SAM-dependent methyltransferase/chromosome segregation ATPase